MPDLRSELDEAVRLLACARSSESCVSVSKAIALLDEAFAELDSLRKLMGRGMQNDHGVKIDSLRAKWPKPEA